MFDFASCRSAAFAAALVLLFAGCSAGTQAQTPDKTPEDLLPGETLARERVPLRAPVQILSKDGRIETDLYVQFSRTTIPGATSNGTVLDTIWTRAYGLDPVVAGQPLPMLDIPGPTFVYHPGDWLQITLHNQLNKALDPQLAAFEENIPLSSQDDIQTPLPHEINIPHNADNTNLHVHGMHVDPKQDDVTLILVPEDDNPSNYTPGLQRFIPDINKWWVWRYGYRLPQDHLPGSHWYHDHKHGATSTHVENGMAGTLVVRPQDPAHEIVPGLWHADPARSHDRVLMVQEIANYGAQQGSGTGRRARMTVEQQGSVSDTTSVDWPEITVNGQHQPNLVLAPGQTERWRLITAGSNHRSGSFYWLAKLTAPTEMDPTLRAALEAITDFESACPYVAVGTTRTCGNPGATLPGTFLVDVEPFDGTVQLVAIDGVTLSQAVDIRPDRPFVAGPGNRADLIVQPSPTASGTYSLVKNYNTPPPMYVLAQNPNYGELFRDPVEGYWRYLALTTSGGTVLSASGGVPSTDPSSPMNPFISMGGDPYGLRGNQTGFKVPWPSAVGPDGTPTAAAKFDSLAIVPLLSGQAVGAGVDAVRVGRIANGAPDGRGWGVISRVAGGGLDDVQVLMTVEVTGRPVEGGPQPPTTAHLERISPTTPNPEETLLVRSTSFDTTEPGIPAYVSPIADADLEGRQVIVFDKSGVDFNYIAGHHPSGADVTTTIHQFSLNGRQFDLNDFVGNPHVDQLIDDPIPPAVMNVFNPDTLGTYAYNGAGTWTNQVRVGGQPQAFYTNPGAFLNVTQATTPSGTNYFTYDYDTDAPPSYTQITGLDAPRQPEATTAEEWVLVNNSGSFHPFHIHISPLFLTEVGQLDYTAGAGGAVGDWAIKQLQPTDPLGYVLNNWWDVVVIPPYGYVKFRTWFNVPNQRPRDVTDPDTDFVVDENANVFGSWVYHCHILRHEDRGMMMVVNVRPKPVPGGHPATDASSGHHRP